MTDYKTIIYERKGRIAYITLNRPEVLNALNATMNLELVDAWQEFDSDPEAYVAILSANGRAFCPGNDMRQRDIQAAERQRALGEEARSARGVGFYSNQRNWKPIIAAVHGYAYATGYLMAMACDLVVAAEATRLQITEVRRGAASGSFWASSWFYSGSRFANEICTTGRVFTAEEALEHGLINYVVPQDQLIAKAEELATEIMKNPPLSVRATVRTIRWYAANAVREAVLYQSGLKLSATEDYREGARALIERRDPVFHAR